MKTVIITLTTLLISIAAACHTMEPTGQMKAEIASALATITVTEKSRLDDFHSIDCSIAAEIAYTPGKKSFIELELPESMAGRIEYEVRNQCLHIRYKGKTETCSFKSHDIRCRIGSPRLEDINLRGATRFTTSAPIESDDFKLECSGAVKMRIPQISCRTFEADFSGASRAEFNICKANRISIQNSGAGQLDITAQSEETEICNSGVGKISANLTGERVSVENSGAGKYTVNVHCKKLTGKNSGVGKCNISGVADEVDLDNSGVSHFDVSRLNQ